MERTSNKNTDENILLEEGILLRVKFRNDGIATLYRKDETDRKKNGERNFGLMLEPVRQQEKNGIPPQVHNSTQIPTSRNFRQVARKVSEIFRIT